MDFVHPLLGAKKAFILLAISSIACSIQVQGKEKLHKKFAVEAQSWKRVRLLSSCFAGVVDSDLAFEDHCSGTDHCRVSVTPKAGINGKKGKVCISSKFKLQTIKYCSVFKPMKDSCFQCRYGCRRAGLRPRPPLRSAPVLPLRGQLRLCLHGKSKCGNHAISPLIRQSFPEGVKL